MKCNLTKEIVPKNNPLETTTATTTTTTKLYKA